MANLRNYSTNCMKQGVCAILNSASEVGYLSGQNVVSKPPVRTFSRTSLLMKSSNFYDDLDIPKSATQSEIKGAYYSLSKIYHPDKNKGSEETAKKFRKISAAYEVLGNVRTRRMYDKGIGSFGKPTDSAGTESEVVEEEVEDDAQTKFYKQHMVKSQPPEMANRTTARDFDQWASDRIKESFEHTQRLKDIHRHSEEDEKERELRGSQQTLVGIFLLTVLGLNVYYQWKHNSTHEAARKKAIAKES